MEPTLKDDIYLIGNFKRKINLEIIAGPFGQSAKMIVEIDGKPAIPGEPEHIGNFPQTSLGLDTKIHRKVVSIIATITDLSKDTNYTSLELIFTGGLTTKTYSLNKIVDEEGQSADYICFIEFFDPNRKS